MMGHELPARDRVQNGEDWSTRHGRSGKAVPYSGSDSTIRAAIILPHLPFQLKRRKFEAVLLYVQ
jgi:hypothetical protein